jgi:hypothetical protein
MAHLLHVPKHSSCSWPGRAHADALPSLFPPANLPQTLLTAVIKQVACCCCCHLKFFVVHCRGATQGLKMVGEYFPWTSGPAWTCSRVVPAGGVSDTAVGKPSKCGPVSADAMSATPQSSHFVYLR